MTAQNAKPPGTPYCRSSRSSDPCPNASAEMLTDGKHQSKHQKLQDTEVRWPEMLSYHPGRCIFNDRHAPDFVESRQSPDFFRVRRSLQWPDCCLCMLLFLHCFVPDFWEMVYGFEDIHEGAKMRLNTYRAERGVRSIVVARLTLYCCPEMHNRIDFDG